MSPPSVAMNVSYLENVSLAIVADRSSLHLLTILASPVCFFANALLVITIVSSKRLHNKSQFMILGNSVAEMVFSVAYFATGLKRYMAYSLQYPIVSTQLNCLLELTPMNMGTGALKLIGMCLALDRFLCIGAPIFFKTVHPYGYVLLLNGACWGCGIFGAALGFLMYDPEQRFPICDFCGTFDIRYLSVMSTLLNSVTVLTAILYLATGCLLMYHYKKVNPIGETQKSAWRQKMEFDVFIVICVIGAIYLIGSGIPSVIMLLATQYPQLQGLILFSIDVPALISSLSHFFVFFFVNNAFRKSFLKLICRRNDNAVVPFVQAGR